MGASSPVAPSPLVQRGHGAYAKYCATCHGEFASGYVADNAPSLRSPTFLSTASDDFVRAGITRGRPGTAMAGYGRSVGGPLEPADVNAIIAFLRDGGPPPRVLPPGRPLGDATRGKIVYDASCARCHGTPTQRLTALHLANPILLETASNEFLRIAIEEGRPPTSMVAWKNVLQPAQIDDVLAYLRSAGFKAAPGGAPLAFARATGGTNGTDGRAPGAVPPAAAAPGQPSPPPGSPPLLPRTGPIVLNPKGRRPDFSLKEGLYVSIDQVKSALDHKQRMIIADARAPSDWLKMHIKGAISTPYYDFKSLDDVPNDGTWVLAYCACPHHVSGEVVAELRKRGYPHTAVIDEGIYAWQQKGYPVVAAPGQPPIPAPPPMPTPSSIAAPPPPSIAAPGPSRPAPPPAAHP